MQRKVETNGLAVKRPKIAKSNEETERKDQTPNLKKEEKKEEERHLKLQSLPGTPLKGILRDPSSPKTSPGLRKKITIAKSHKIKSFLPFLSSFFSLFLFLCLD